MLPYIFERPVIFQSRMASFLPLAIGARIQLVPVVFRVERGKEYGRHCLGCKFFACTSIEATLLRRGYIVSVSFPLSASSVCAPSSRFCVQPCRTSSLDKCTYLLGYRFANTFAVKAAHRTRGLEISYGTATFLRSVWIFEMPAAADLRIFVVPLTRADYLIFIRWINAW